MLMLCLNVSDITIIAVKGIDHCCFIHDISKYDAIHLLENHVLDDRGYIYKMHFTDINVKNRDYNYYFDTVSLKQKYRSKKSMRKLIKNEINEKKLD